MAPTGGEDSFCNEKIRIRRESLQDNFYRAEIAGGKYKIELLWYIGKCDIRRFGQLRRQIGEITESSLTKQLRELEADGFILRHDFCEVPPRVEYTLTELGESFLSVLDCMKAWGDKNLHDEQG